MEIFIQKTPSRRKIESVFKDVNDASMHRESLKG